MADNDDIDKQIKDAVLSKVGKALARGVNQSYVEELKDRIVQRTRLGIGVDPESKRGVRFEKLNKDYIRRRKGVKKIKDRNKIDTGRRKKARGTGQPPQLASTTTPSKSNLTLSGQLLKALTVIKIKSKEGIGFKITVGDQRGKGAFGEAPTIGNKQLVKELEKKGRYFLDFTKAQRNEISKEIRQILRKFLS